MWLIWLISLATVAYMWVQWKLTYWKRCGVPHPEPTFFLGNTGPTITFKEHTGALAHKWYNEFPDDPWVGYYKFLTPGVLVRDPQLILDILIKDYAYFNKNDFHVNEKLDPLLTKNPFFTIGESWKRGRSVLLQMFTISKTRSIYPKMEVACTRMINYLKSQPSDRDYDAKSLSAKFTTENVIKCTFSLDAWCFEPGANEFRECGKKMWRPSSKSAINLLLKPLLPTWITSLTPFPVLSPHVEQFFRKVVAENKKSRENIEMADEDYMQMLLNIGKKCDASDDEITGHTIGIFLDGFETASTGMGWCFYELARSPHCQQRLYEEIMEISAKHNNKFTYDALEEMIYLDGVVHESMRMHPPTLILSKLCTKTYTMPTVGDQKDGVTIYPGTSITIPSQAIHMDAHFYPEPETFQPERFYETERKSRHKAHYLPFGEGSRMCIGTRFGTVQLKAGLMAIVRDFKISLSPRHIEPIRVDPKSILNQALDRILVKFDTR